MTKIIFVRHGEPDYTDVQSKNYAGHGTNFAHLTEEGIKQAEDVSQDKRLDGAQIIIASPYTRALQTAAIISKNRNLDIKVELDLHEWHPDLTFQNSTYEDMKKADKLCAENKGVCPKDCEVAFENFEDVFLRVKNTLLKYNDYSKVIVVAHGVVIRQFTDNPSIPFCGIREIDLDEGFKWVGFVPLQN
ncbi:MAG: phosphoglycerate mutase family protein [Defluviitaleaceae bacterium]|nr:phosphoglycerate mutase family protein [Defluviitaleaceae bacterium]